MKQHQSPCKVEEAKANAFATTFTLKDDTDSNLVPKVVEPTQLYYIFSKERHMHLLDQKYLEYPKAYSNEMRKLHKEGVLPSKISAAFSTQWVNEEAIYLYITYVFICIFSIY